MTGNFLQRKDARAKARETREIPQIEVWIEGLLDYFGLECPQELPVNLRFGFMVGQQVIGLYVIEVLLKYTLQQRRRAFRQDHNLRKLFRGLAPRDQKKVQKKYQEILRTSTQTALDIEATVSALLTYLGHNPITSTRYFWEYSHPETSVMSILIAPHMLRRVIYAIMIPLHRYPEKPGTRRPFATRFRPREDWVEGGKEEESGRNSKKPEKDWMIGLRIYFGQPFPHSENDPRKLGFGVGSYLAGLYLGEMLLKYGLDERGMEYEENHNLEALFRRLPTRDQEYIRECYKGILHSEPGHAWDFQRSIDELLNFLQQNPFTESRYFWDVDPAKRKVVLFSPQVLVPLIDSLFHELHGIRTRESGTEFYDRDFESFEESIKNQRIEEAVQT